MDDTASKILSRIDSNNLLVVPQVLLDLMKEIQQENADLDYLAKLIGQDSGLSAKIMIAANSPYYRQCGAIQDLRRVLVVLGLTTVKTLIITVVIHQFFNKIPQTQQNLLERIWYRSFSCAHTARHLAQLIAYPFPDEAYLAGLLHRLGQLILLAYYADDYAVFLSQHFDEQDDRIELQTFGVTYTEIGAQLVSNWKLQSFIGDALRYQRQPIETIAESAGLVKLINSARQLSCLNPGNKYPLLAQAGQLFGLHQGLLEELLQETQLLVEQTSDSLGIKITDPNLNDSENLTTQQPTVDPHELLGQYVQKIVLSATVQQAIATPSELNSLISIIQRDLSVMFGFRGVAIFIYQIDKQSLASIAGVSEQDTVWSTLAIKPDSNSLLARAWSKNRILHSFNCDKAALDTLIDRQICQLLAVEDLLAIPMYHQGQALGVIAAGLKLTDVKRIKSNLEFIQMYVEHATKSIYALQTVLTVNTSELSQFRSDYQLQAQKLVHEIANPLTLISNYLHLLEIKAGERYSDELRIIQEEIGRVGTLLLRLPDLAQEDQNDLRSVDVNELILDLLKLFEAGGFSIHIEVTLDLDRNLTSIATDRNKLKQILTNLIKNAFEAMSSGGNFRVNTKEQVIQNGKPYLEIVLIDSGPGLSEEIQRNLFHPVDSTKGKHHSGLGLTISKNLMNDLNGFIHCNSGETGTQFRLLLPRVN